MRVLVACEFSGIVRAAFAARGHDAWSCDLLPAGGNHITGDVRDVLADGWDLMIAHPPCTYLSVSGLHWNTRRPGRAAQTADAIRFVELLWNAPVTRIAIENPVGCLSTRSKLGRPFQIIQPYDFGDDASKATCLWLRGLMPLRPTMRVAGRQVSGRERWSNQTDSGQNHLTPSPERWKLRSETYPGIARAMADQWG